jgi:hypothetical protein
MLRSTKKTRKGHDGSVEKGQDAATRLLYDFCTEDVPIYGRPYFDWRKEDHIAFLNASRMHVIDLYDRGIAGATVLDARKASTTQPQYPITIPSAYTIQPRASGTAPPKKDWPGQLPGRTDTTDAVLNVRNDEKFKI